MALPLARRLLLGGRSKSLLPSVYSSSSSSSSSSSGCLFAVCTAATNSAFSVAPQYRSITFAAHSLPCSCNNCRSCGTLGSRGPASGLRSISTSSRCLADADPEGDANVDTKDYDPKLVNIVDEISKLTLLEVADLTELMKKKLNIIDAPMMGMPMGGMPVGGASASPAEEEPKEEQTEFDVKLEAFDAKSKVKIIKEIKSTMDGMNLVQAKKFVEDVPGTIKEGVSKADAEELKKKFEELGATIVLE